MDAKTEFASKWVMKIVMGGWLIYLLAAFYLKMMLPFTYETIVIKLPYESFNALLAFLVWTIICCIIGGVLGFALYVRKQEPPMQNYMG